MENDLERFILAAIASSFVLDDVVCLENWKNRLKTRAVAFRSDFFEREKRLSEMETAWFHAQVDHMDYRLIYAMKVENINMESIRKLSNFDFQWTKTLYQNI